MSSWGTQTGITIAAASLAVALAGCAGSVDPDAAASVPTPTVTVTMTPAPAPTPTPDPATCETAFTADLFAQFAEDGLTYRGDQYTEHIDEFASGDGLRCRWGVPQTDILAEYATWSRDAVGWENLKTELMADGYVKSGPFALTRPTDEYTSAFSYRDGVVHYASPARLIGWVAALQ